MKIEDLSVGDKVVSPMEVAGFTRRHVILKDRFGGEPCVLPSELEHYNDKYKRALIDLYRSCVENRPSFPEHLEISEYNKAVSIFDDERTKSINRAIALGMELVEGGES